MLPRTTQFARWYSVTAQPLAAPDGCRLTEEQARRLMAYVRGLLRRAAGCAEQEPARPDDDLPPAPVHVSYRLDGAYGGEGIGLGGSLHENLQAAVRRAVELRRAVAAGGADASDVPTVYLASALGGFAFDASPGPREAKGVFPRRFAERLGIELTLFHSPHSLDGRGLAGLQADLEPGVHGLGIEAGGRVSLFSSSKWLIHNYSHERMLARLSESVGLAPGAYRDPACRLVRLETVHLVQRGPDAPVERLFRGDRTIGADEVTGPRVGEALAAMGRWLLAGLRDDGRLEYKYMPSRGSYSSANNMIRQWMATQAFGALFEATGEQPYADAWRRNVRFNLARYYVEKDDYGYVFYNGKAKLGAAACALMALLAGPDRPAHAEAIERLRRLILRLGEPDGSFRTFLLPADRNDLQSFYSGEALLALALLAETGADEEALAARLRRGMDFYMPFYRSTRRYTPFVPWHTMAYRHLYRRTGDEACLRAVFEMNDWLICIQDVEPDSAPDVRGRFYRDEFAWNGPPHASSTAVYVEGLAHAYDLARSAGDAARADAYLHAIRLGLRSLMQLQFRPTGAFYLRHKQRVLGGLRTTVTDNQLRCDNTQHAVMAALAVLRLVGEADLAKPCPQADAFRRECLARFVPAAAPSGAQPARAEGHATVLLAGDVQLGRYTEAWARRQGLAHAFRGIAEPLARADAFVANLECVVAEGGAEAPKRGRKVWHLRASPDMLGVFGRGGTNVLSLANNHTMDYGPEALREMVETHLPAAGILFAGAGPSGEAASQPAVFEVRGLRIALHSVTTIEPEFAAADDRAGYHWVCGTDAGRFREGLRRLLDRWGGQAELNFLAVHWGRNHDAAVPPMHMELAHAAVEMGFRLVVGHHAHVNRGIEVHHGVPIFYDLGNCLVDFKFQGWDDKSVLVAAAVNAAGVHAVELIPVNLHDKAVNLAVGREAELILERVEQLSRPFGTRIARVKGRGFVQLSPSAAAPRG